MHRFITIAAAALLSLPASAQDFDQEAAESAFRRCKSCHQISDGDQVLVPGGRTGPNLFGVIGRMAGSFGDFRYSDGMIAAGEAGLVWNEENLPAFIAGPSEFLRNLTEDSSARSRMTPQRLRPDDAAALAAWLAGFGGTSGEN